MKLLIQSAALALAATIASPVFAEIQPPATLGDAVSQFAETNTRLEQLLIEGLTPDNMAQIHELTYTLQAALTKINEDMDELTETLEELHIASEAQQADEVKSYASDYLKTARTVIK